LSISNNFGEVEMLSTSITNPRAPGNGPGWTDTRTERLKKLWADGHPASGIAALLGEVTRNAVIGKVHRLGLAARKTTSRQPVPCRTSPRRNGSGRAGLRQAPARFVRSASPLPPAPPPPVAALMLPLRQLRADQCRWPIGDPKEDGFGFCGCQKAPSVPYCAHHAAIAYNPAARRGRFA
jgi:GcrA cell cycle regulator